MLEFGSCVARRTLGWPTAWLTDYTFTPVCRDDSNITSSCTVDRNAAAHGMRRGAGRRGSSGVGWYVVTTSTSARAVVRGAGMEQGAGGISCDFSDCLRLCPSLYCVPGIHT